MSFGRIFLALLVVLGFLIAAATVLVALKPALFFEMEGKSLALSVADELGDTTNSRMSGQNCRRRGGDHWRCTVDEDPGSGASRTYLVRAVDDECWRLGRRSQAELRRRFDEPHQKAEACLSFLDYVGFG